MNCIFGDKECIVSPSQKCDQNGVVYKLQYKACNTFIEEDDTLTRIGTDMKKPSYLGLTRTTLHNRMTSHLRSRRNKNTLSPMWKHDRDAHRGIAQEYNCTIIGQVRKIVLDIEKLGLGQKINSREECGRGQSFTGVWA